MLELLQVERMLTLLNVEVTESCDFESRTRVVMSESPGASLPMHSIHCREWAQALEHRRCGCLPVCSVPHSAKTMDATYAMNTRLETCLDGTLQNIERGSTPRRVENALRIRFRN